MKKLLTYLMSLAVISGSTSSLVACKKEAPSNIPTDESYKDFGKDIDKSKAVDDSIKNNSKSDYSNYYILGDSLSDINGITSYLKDYLLQSPFANALKGKEIHIDFDDYLVEGAAKKTSYYGFNETVGGKTIRRSSFTNGYTAAALLGQKLGFTDVYGSNIYTKNYISDELKFGNNYAIGGATAVQPSGTDILQQALKDTSIVSQSKAVIQQHVINDKDLAFYAIGSNDVIAMLGMTDSAKINEYKEKMMAAVEESLYTLLNNGLKKILFVTPPTMEQVPRFKDKDKATVKALCDDVNKKLLDIVDSINKNYKDSIQVYDLNSTINGAIDAAAKGDNPLKVDAGYTGGYGSAQYSYMFDANGDGENDANKWQAMQGLDVTALLAAITKHPTAKNAYLRLSVLGLDEKQDVDKYFFMDDIHPTKITHADFANKFMDFLNKK
ncbi:hypothetical protein SHELI_v1c09150 [Spiroplasma helicoides]|uniref:Lipolytic enzyme, GDSL family n=1 Tax=Spiroplasma helicoides TaxID=216938 RepID=A0A1B3SLR5_9MOLU|nr:SGNH/GDSL hydrolase family protein [Spiroplasma helicoides]AOG60864.1 hypothetical protein SHELI_v1c09150 [Spiroplasma helicoides]